MNSKSFEIYFIIHNEAIFVIRVNGGQAVKSSEGAASDLIMEMEMMDIS